MLLAGFAAMAGLFWTPSNDVVLKSELYGLGLYRRDTPFVAGGSQGSDLFSLFVVLPLAACYALDGLSTRLHFGVSTIY
jgi:hypothetical protein